MLSVCGYWVPSCLRLHVRICMCVCVYVCVCVCVCTRRWQSHAIRRGRITDRNYCTANSDLLRNFNRMFPSQYLAYLNSNERQDFTRKVSFIAKSDFVPKRSSGLGQTYRSWVQNWPKSDWFFVSYFTSWPLEIAWPIYLISRHRNGLKNTILFKNFSSVLTEFNLV